MKILNLPYLNAFPCIFILLFFGLHFQIGGSSLSLSSERNDPFCNETPNISVSAANRIRNSRSLNKPSPTELFENLLSRRIFNTTMNFIVPGAKVTLPHSSVDGSLIHLAMQAFFGLFWAVAWISTTAVPLALTYFHPLGLRRSFDHEDDFHLKWQLNDKLAEGIGLNWTSCLRKTICQAHNPTTVHKYGVLGKTIRVLFPASADISTLPLSSSQSQFWKSATRGAIGQNCNRIYKCFFDVLDVILYVKDLLLGRFSTLN